MPIINDPDNPYAVGTPTSTYVPPAPVPPPVQPPSQQAPIPAPPPEDAYNQTVANSIGTQWNVGYEEDAYQQAPPEPEPEAPTYPSYPNPFGEGFEADFQGGPSTNIILPTTSFPSPQQSIQDLYNAAWMQYDQANPMPLPGEGTPLFGTKWFGTPGEQEEQSQNWIAEVNKAQTYWNRNIPFGNGAGQTGQEYYNQLQRERQTAERGWSMYQASATQHQLSVQDRFNMQFQQSLNQAARMGEGQDLVQLTGPDGKPQFVPRAIAQQMVAGLTPEMVDAARLWNKTEQSGNPFAVSPPRIQVPGQQGDLYASELDQQNRLQQLTGAQARFFGQTQEKTALDPFGQMPQQDTGLGGALGGIVSNPFTQRLGQGLGAVGRSGFNLPGIGDVTVGGAFSKTFIRPAEIAAQGYTYQAATARQIMVDAGIPLSMVDMIMVGQSPILGMMATANYTPVKADDITIAHYLSSARETYDTQSTAQRLALELVLDPWNLFPGAAIKAGVRGRLAGRVLGGALDEQTTRTFLIQTKSVFEQRRILATYTDIQSDLFAKVGHTALSDATAKSLAARVWMDANAGTAMDAAREAAIKATYDDLPAMAERVGASETQLRQVRAWLGSPRTEQVIAAVTNTTMTPEWVPKLSEFQMFAPGSGRNKPRTPYGEPALPSAEASRFVDRRFDTPEDVIDVTFAPGSGRNRIGPRPVRTVEDALEAKAQLDLVTEQTPDAHRIAEAAKQQPLPEVKPATVGPVAAAYATPPGSTFRSPSKRQQETLDSILTAYKRNPKGGFINQKQAARIEAGLVSFDEAMPLINQAVQAKLGTEAARAAAAVARTDDPEIALQVSGHLPPVAADDPLRPVLYDAAVDRAKISAERWKAVQPFLPKPDLEPTHYPKGRGAWVRPTEDSPTTYKSIIQFLNQIDLDKLSPMVRNVVEEIINVEPYKDLTSSSYRPYIQKVLAKDLPEALAHGEATDVDFGLVSGALADAHVQDQVAKANEIERQVAKQARKQPAKVAQETKELTALKTEHADLMNQRDLAWSQGANDIVKMIDKQAAAVKDRIMALDPNWLPTERPTIKTATKLAQDHERTLIQHGLTPEVVPPPSDPANGFAREVPAPAGAEPIIDPVIQNQADATTDILTHAATVTTPAPSPVIRPSPAAAPTGKWQTLVAGLTNPDDPFERAAAWLEYGGPPTLSLLQRALKQRVPFDQLTGVRWDELVTKIRNMGVDPAALEYVTYQTLDAASKQRIPVPRMPTAPAAAAPTPFAQEAVGVTPVGYTRFESYSKPERIQKVLDYGAYLDENGDILVPTEFADYLYSRLKSALISVERVGAKRSAQVAAERMTNIDRVMAEGGLKSYVTAGEVYRDDISHFGEWFSDAARPKELEKRTREYEERLAKLRGEHLPQWRVLATEGFPIPEEVLRDVPELRQAAAAPTPVSPVPKERGKRRTPLEKAAQEREAAEKWVDGLSEKARRSIIRNLDTSPASPSIGTLREVWVRGERLTARLRTLGTTSSEAAEALIRRFPDEVDFGPYGDKDKILAELRQQESMRQSTLGETVNAAGGSGVIGEVPLSADDMDFATRNTAETRPDTKRTDFLSGKPGVYYGWRGGDPETFAGLGSGGMYVSRESRYAMRYAAEATDKRLMRVQIVAKNPFNLQDPQRVEELKRLAEQIGDKAPRGANMQPRTARALLDQGYDVVVFGDVVGGSISEAMLVLDPSVVRTVPVGSSTVRAFTQHEVADQFLSQVRHFIERGDDPRKIVDRLGGPEFSESDAARAYLDNILNNPGRESGTLGRRTDAAAPGSDATLFTGTMTPPAPGDRFVEDLADLAQEMNWSPEVTGAVDFFLGRVARRMSPDNPARWVDNRKILITDLKDADSYTYIPDIGKSMITLTKTGDVGRGVMTLFHEEMHAVVDLLSPEAYRRLQKAFGLSEGQELSSYHWEQVSEGTERLLQRLLQRNGKDVTAAEIAANPFWKEFLVVYVDVVNMISDFVDSIRRRFGSDMIHPEVYKWLKEFFSDAEGAGWAQFLEPGELSRANRRTLLAGNSEGGVGRLDIPRPDAALVMEMSDPYTAGGVARVRQFLDNPSVRSEAQIKLWMDDIRYHLESGFPSENSIIDDITKGVRMDWGGGENEARILFSILSDRSKNSLDRMSPNGHRGAYKPTIDPVTAEIEQADWAVLGPKHDAYMSRVYDFSDEARAMQITDKKRLADLSVNSYILENADLTDLIFGRQLVGEAFHGFERHGMNPDEFVQEAFRLIGDTKNSVQRLGQFHGGLGAHITHSKKGAAWLREMRSVVPGHDGMNAAQVLGKMWNDGKFNQTPALGWFDKIIKTPKNKVWQEGDLRELNKVLTSVAKPRGMSNNDWIAVLDLRRIIGNRWETFRLNHDPRLPVTTDEINAALFPVVTPQGVATNTSPHVYDLTGMADKMASMHAALMAERLGFDPDKVDHAMRMMRVVKGNMVPLWMTMLPGYHLRNIMGNATSHLIAALRSDMHVNPLFIGGHDRELLSLAGNPEAGISMPAWVDSGMSTDVGSDIQQGAKVGKGEKYALSLWQKEKKEGSERLIHKTLLRPGTLPERIPLVGGKAVNPFYQENRILTATSDVGERYAKKNAWSQEFRWQYNNEWRTGLNTITLPGNLKNELVGVLDKRVVAQKIAGLDPDTRKQVFLLHERAVAVGNIYGQNTARNTFRDYRMRSKMDGIMDHVIPIHFWTTRNALFVGRTALDRPGAVAGAVMAYNAWEQSNQNLPPSMRTGLARIPKGITTFLGVPDDDDYYMRVGNIINPAVFAVPKLLNPAAWDLSGTSLQERIVNASKSGFQNMWSSMGYRVGPQVDFLFRGMKAADQWIPDSRYETLEELRKTLVDGGGWFTQRHTPPGYKSGEWNSYNTEFFPWQNLIAGVSRKPNIGKYEAPISPQQAIEWFNQTTTGSHYTRNEYVKIGYRISENVEDGNLTQEQGMIAMLALADGQFDYDEEYAAKIKARNHTEDYEKAMGGLENIDPAEAKRRREWNNPNLTDAQIDEALHALRPIIDEVADTQAYGWLLQAVGASGQTRSGTVKDSEAKADALNVLGGADDLQRIFHSKREYERIKDEQGGMLADQFLFDEHPEILAWFAANDQPQEVDKRVDDYMMNTNRAHAYALTALHYAGQRVERARKSPDTGKTINDYYDELGQVMDASERAKARAGDNMVMYDKAHQTMVRMREDVYAAAEADGFNMIGSDFLPREGRSFYAVQAGDLSVLPPRERARYEEAGFSTERRVMEREQEQRAHYLDLALETLGLWDYDSKGTPNPRFTITTEEGNKVLDRNAYQAALQEEAALVPSTFIELMHQDTREGVDVQVGTLMQGVTEADVLLHTRDKEAKLHAWQAEKSAAAEAAANETDPVKRRELWTAYYDTYTEGPRVYGNDNGFTSGQNRIYNEGGNRLGDMYANNLTPTQKDQFRALHPEAFTEKVDPTEGYTYQSFDWRKLPGEVIAIELDRLGFDADGKPLGIRQDGAEYGRNQRDTAPSGRFDAATVTHIEEMIEQYYNVTPEGWDKQATEEALGAQREVIEGIGQQMTTFNGQQMTFEEAANIAKETYSNKSGGHTWTNALYKVPGGPESELGQYIKARLDAGAVVGQVYDVRDAWFNNLSAEDQKLLLEQGGLDDEGEPQFSVPEEYTGGATSTGGTGGDGGYTRRPWIDYPSRSGGGGGYRSYSSSGGGGGGGSSGGGSFYYRVLYDADPVLSAGQDDGRGVIVRQVGDSISRLFELLKPLYDAMPYGEDQFKNIQNAFLGHIRLRIHQNPTIEGWQSLLDWLLQFFTPAVSPPQAGVSIPAPAAPGTIPGTGGPPALPPPAPGPAPVPVPTPQPSAGVGVPVVY